MTTVAPWAPSDRDAVIAMIVGIQQGEFGLAITAADQPDLADVDASYRSGGGEFWVARDDGGAVVGTIAALVFDEGAFAIRKMFVDASQRGTGLAGHLMETLIAWARGRGLLTAVLGTTAVMHGAQRFYAKHGFEQIAESALPRTFPRMAVDSVFFRRALDQDHSAG